MARLGKIKRINLTPAEIAKRFPDALEFADWQLDDLHERGEVAYLVTRKDHLQCHVTIASSPSVVLSTRATWHVDAKTWVRYSCGFRWRGYPEPMPLQAGQPVYLMPDGTVRARPPRYGALVMIGVALAAPVDGCVKVHITTPTFLPGDPIAATADIDRVLGMIYGAGHMLMPVSKDAG